MAVYYLKNSNWESIVNFWENKFPNDFKDETAFQMEPFPEEEPKSITFISNNAEAVKLVKETFTLEENKYWTSVGSQGLKRLTGDNSKWADIPLKND